jgi:hypothetical protein
MNGTSAPGNFGTLATALPLLLVLLIVVRFAFRELRERIVRIPTIWIRPALLLALSAYLVVLTMRLDPGDGAITASAVLIGAVLGLVTGIAVIRNTTFAAAEVPNAVRVRGNRIGVSGARAGAIHLSWLRRSGRAVAAQLRNGRAGFGCLRRHRRRVPPADRAAAAALTHCPW